MLPLQKGTMMQARDRTPPQTVALQFLFYDGWSYKLREIKILLLKHHWCYFTPFVQLGHNISKILHLFYKLRLQNNIFWNLAFDQVILLQFYIYII